MERIKYRPPDRDGQRKECITEVWKFPVDEKKKGESLSEIRQEVTKKRIRYYPSFAEIVWNQMRFQPWSHWALEGGLLLFLMFLAFYLPENAETEREILTVCSVFFVFSGNIALSSIARLFSRNMAELEQTLYLNLKQMVCIRMLEAGIFALFTMGILLSIAGKRSIAGTVMCVLYILVPFLWSDVFYLHMLEFLRNAASGFRSFAMGLICGLLACFPLLEDKVYNPEYRYIWFFLAAAGIILLAGRIRRIFETIEGGEILCLN